MTDLATHWRNLRASRKQAGVCTACGARKPRKGCARCARCIKRSRNYRKNLRELYSDHRLCWRCKGKLGVGEWSICGGCLTEKRERDAVSKRSRRAARVAAGLCAACGEPRERYAFACDACQAEQRERQRVG
jgi:predicted amidophosphoribosyltransferase